MNNLQKVMTILLTATRLGADKDEPEGARYVQISETLVNQMIEYLKQEKQDRIDALRYAVVLDRQWQTGSAGDAGKTLISD